MKRYIKSSEDLVDSTCKKIFDEIRNFANEHLGGLAFDTPEYLGVWEEDGVGLVCYSDLCKFLRDNLEAGIDTNPLKIYWQVETYLSNAQTIEFCEEHGLPVPEWLLDN